MIMGTKILVTYLYDHNLFLFTTLVPEKAINITRAKLFS